MLIDWFASCSSRPVLLRRWFLRAFWGQWKQQLLEVGSEDTEPFKAGLRNDEGYFPSSHWHKTSKKVHQTEWADAFPGLVSTKSSASIRRVSRTFCCSIALVLVIVVASVSWFRTQVCLQSPHQATAVFWRTAAKPRSIGSKDSKLHRWSMTNYSTSQLPATWYPSFETVAVVCKVFADKYAQSSQNKHSKLEHSTHYKQKSAAWNMPDALNDSFDAPQALGIIDQLKNIFSIISPSFSVRWSQHFGRDWFTHAISQKKPALRLTHNLFLGNRTDVNLYYQKLHCFNTGRNILEIFLKIDFQQVPPSGLFWKPLSARTILGALLI